MPQCTHEGRVAALRESVAEAVNAARRRSLATIRRWLADPRAVTLDVETTDIKGAVVKVSVATLAGRVGAQAVHAIRLEELASAPSWLEVLPRVEALLEGRGLYFGWLVECPRSFWT